MGLNSLLNKVSTLKGAAIENGPLKALAARAQSIQQNNAADPTREKLRRAPGGLGRVYDLLVKSGKLKPRTVQQAQKSKPTSMYSRVLEMAKKMKLQKPTSAKPETKPMPQTSDNGAQPTLGADGSITKRKLLGL